MCYWTGFWKPVGKDDRKEQANFGFKEWICRVLFTEKENRKKGTGREKTPRPIKFKLLNIKDKEKIFETTRKKRQIIMKETKVRIRIKFLTETM